MDRKRSVAELFATLCVSVRGPVGDGLRGGFFHQGRFGYISHFQCALCHQRIHPLTVGIITILMHCVFITLQILILRKRYQPVQLMQLPVALVFGL